MRYYIIGWADSNLAHHYAREKKIKIVKRICTWCKRDAWFDKRHDPGSVPDTDAVCVTCAEERDMGRWEAIDKLSKAYARDEKKRHRKGSKA